MLFTSLRDIEKLGLTAFDLQTTGEWLRLCLLLRFEFGNWVLFKSYLIAWKEKLLRKGLMYWKSTLRARGPHMGLLLRLPLVSLVSVSIKLEIETNLPHFLPRNFLENCQAAFYVLFVFCFQNCTRPWCIWYCRYFRKFCCTIWFFCLWSSQ